MLSYLQYLTNNAVTNAIYNNGGGYLAGAISNATSNIVNSQAITMLKNLNFYSAPIVFPATVLVGSSVLFLSAAKKSPTTKQKALAVIGSIACAALAALYFYDLFNASAPKWSYLNSGEFGSNPSSTKKAECLKSAFDQFQNCIK
ncbi:MAG: hypothetical protein K1060chlam1_00557 [Candidatus Anoxychlamydiales bacterium]|nr:hypothetical protein [Candidatus Anoxychlamydiales bacterium]